MSDEVASPELARELEGLSGWETPSEVTVFGEKTYQQYTLGYLLRKLPEEIDQKILVALPNGDRPHIGYAERDNYGDYTLDDRFYRDAAYALELQDAAAKLCIQLIKQGVIKP